MAVYAVHHGTDDGDSFPPDLTPHPDWREFETDEGYAIKLAEGFRVFVGLDFISCAGAAYPVRLQYYPRFESVVDTEDTERTTVGTLDLPPGTYCALDIHYGPYEYPPSGSEDPRPGEKELDGKTVLLRGSADDEHDFDWAKSLDFTVRRSLAEIDAGGALRIDRDAGNAKRIAVTLTYDRLLDGVDFDDSSPDFERAVVRGIKKHTGVMLGLNLVPGEVSYD